MKARAFDRANFPAIPQQIQALTFGFAGDRVRAVLDDRQQDGSSEWKTTQSFGAGDIPRLMRVLALCDEWLADSVGEKAA